MPKEGGVPTRNWMHIENNAVKHPLLPAGLLEFSSFDQQIAPPHSDYAKSPRRVSSHALETRLALFATVDSLG